MIEAWQSDSVLNFETKKLRRRLHSRLTEKQILAQKSKVRVSTDIFYLDITPLLTIFVAIVLTMFLSLTCRSVKMAGASLLLLYALI